MNIYFFCPEELLNAIRTMYRLRPNSPAQKRERTRLLAEVLLLADSWHAIDDNDREAAIELLDAVAAHLEAHKYMLTAKTIRSLAEKRRTHA